MDKTVDQKARDMASGADAKIEQHAATCEVRNEYIERSLQENAVQHELLFGLLRDIGRQGWLRWFTFGGAMIGLLVYLLVEVAKVGRSVAEAGLGP